MKLVHCKKEPFTHYIGRPSLFGNPYVIGKDGTREQVVIKFKRYAVQYLLEEIKSLPKDAVLACWCSPQDCHGNAIMEIWEDLQCDTTITITISDGKPEEKNKLN
jgi:hypothetical protein